MFSVFGNPDFVPVVRECPVDGGKILNFGIIALDKKTPKPRAEARTNAMLKFKGEDKPTHIPRVAQSPKDRRGDLRRERPEKERRAEQIRQHQKTFRQVKKKCRDGRNATLLGRVRKLSGKPTECRRLTQYRRRIGECILTVGTRPSADGALGPISQTISHVRVSIGKWAVDFCRGRCSRYYR